MDRRQKILATLVAVLLAGFILDKFALSPWLTAMASVQKEIEQVRSDRISAQEKAKREPEVAAEWNALRDRLKAVKGEEASNRLAAFVDQLIKKYDLKKSSLSPDPNPRLVGNNACREHALSATFQCGWEGFVRLLIDLHNTEDFVKLQRINVQSHYLVEKESYLDVTLRLSTVAPVTAGGGK
jgi:hypothetical protein